MFFQSPWPQFEPLTVFMLRKEAKKALPGDVKRQSILLNAKKEANYTFQRIEKSQNVLFYAQERGTTISGKTDMECEST